MSRINIDELTASLNKLRLLLNSNSVNRQELNELFDKFPYKAFFITYLVKNNCLVKSGRQYYFPSHPIHKDKVAFIIDQIRTYLRREHTLNEQECINFLKSKGYIVLKQL